MDDCGFDYSDKYIVIISVGGHAVMHFGPYEDWNQAHDEMDKIHEWANQNFLNIHPTLRIEELFTLS